MGEYDKIVSEFNSIFHETFDQTISETLGGRVLEALYDGLLTNHGVTRDDLPNRLPTVFAVLSWVFGTEGERTIERAIAHRLCQKFNLTFEENQNHRLEYYREMALRKIAEMQRTQRGQTSLAIYAAQLGCAARFAPNTSACSSNPEDWMTHLEPAA